MLSCTLHRAHDLCFRFIPPPPPPPRASAVQGTNSDRLFTPGERKALAKSKVHQ
jgi:hypothetical protein